MTHPGSSQNDQGCSSTALRIRILAVTLSVVIVLAAMPANAQQVASKGLPRSEEISVHTSSGPETSAGSRGRMNPDSIPQPSESLRETLDLLRTPGFHQELTDLLSPELSLASSRTGEAGHFLSGLGLQNPEETAEEEKKGLHPVVWVLIGAAAVIGVSTIVTYAVIANN